MVWLADIVGWLDGGMDRLLNLDCLSLLAMTSVGSETPRALTSLSDLTDHMDSFLLASQRLTRSGQGETDYNYFKLFLETVSGFPSVPASMAGYYTQYPAILQPAEPDHAFPVPGKFEGSPHSR
jgi:hypothetical protein